MLNALSRSTEPSMRVWTFLVVVPVAVIAATLAVANRELVAFQFDPFETGSALVMPLFLLVFFSFLLGVLVGGATVALRRSHKGRRRRAAASDIATAMAMEAAKPSTKTSGP